MKCFHCGVTIREVSGQWYDFSDVNIAYCKPDGTLHEPDLGPAPDELLVSRGQVTSAVLRIKEVFGIEDHEARSTILSLIVGREVPTTKDLSVEEYRDVVKYLEAIKDTPGVDRLLLEVRHDRVSERKDEEGFPELNLGGASKEVVASTMKKVMHMTGAQLGPLLKKYNLSGAGKINDKRLRFYEFCCRERAKGNQEVEGLFK